MMVSKRANLGEINYAYNNTFTNVKKWFIWSANVNITFLTDDTTVAYTGVTCTDTDDEVTNMLGFGCSSYFEDWCDILDDDDFIATEMCCTCGGGKHSGNSSYILIETSIYIYIIKVLLWDVNWWKFISSICGPC